MTQLKVILVTGANRGIGYAIVQRLASHSPTSIIILTSRELENAKAAALELQRKGISSPIQAEQLDVTDNKSLAALSCTIQSKWGRLDVLVNNAGYAAKVADDKSDYRHVWNSIYNINVTSVGLVTETLLPLLDKSDDPRVINISSGRASFARNSENPPTAVMAYSVSKVALNMLTVELAKAFPNVHFQAVNPGHCKTAFNGFRGTRDPLDGAIGVAELAFAARGKYSPGFWEYSDKGEMVIVPW